MKNFKVYLKLRGFASGNRFCRNRYRIIAFRRKLISTDSFWRVPKILNLIEIRLVVYYMKRSDRCDHRSFCAYISPLLKLGLAVAVVFSFLYHVVRKFCFPTFSV
jgi:hypothetical protein